MADWLRLNWGSVPKAFKRVSAIYADDSGNLKVRNPDGTSEDLSGGGSPGAVTLLGPFAITKDTTDLVNPGGLGAIVGPTLEEGTVILAAWIKTTTSWVAETSIDNVGMSLVTNPQTLFDWSTGAGVKLNGGAPYLNSDGPAVPLFPLVIQGGTDQLSAYIYTTGAMTAGAGDIYALICAP